MTKKEVLLFTATSLFLLVNLTPSVYSLSLEGTSIGLGYVAMAIAIGLASISAGYAVAKTGSAAIASLTEKPELFARVLIFAGLAEGIAIYGIIIALLIWITIPT